MLDAAGKASLAVLGGVAAELGSST